MRFLFRLALGAMGAVLVTAVLLPAASPAGAAGLSRSDIASGSNARDEAGHAAGASLLTPAVVAPAAPLASRAPAMRPRREVFGFAPYWELAAQGPWDIDRLTTIAYFGVDVREDGSFDAGTPGWRGWSSRQLTDLVGRAHARGVRVVLTIKQFDERSINRIVTDPAATEAAVAGTVAAIAARGLDGVNVDFEGSHDPRYPGIQAGTTRFMTRLSDRVHGRWPAAEVSIDTYTGSASWDGGIFVIGDLAPHVDAFFVMAYDMAASNMPGLAGPTAPLTGFTYNDSTAVAQYLARAPASKVILGVPYYGYKWSTRDDRLYSVATSGAMADTYSGILDDMRCAQMRLALDARSQTPWAVWYSPRRGDPCGANRGTWRELYYDNVSSLGRKYDLVNGSGIRGAGIWALGYDGDSHDLWNLLRDKFG